MELSLTLNMDFFDQQYQRWKSDPEQLPHDWQVFFQGFELALSGEKETAGAGQVCDENHVLRQARVEALIYGYRDLGHVLACLDPLAACPVDHPLLRLSAFGLGEEDLDRDFFCSSHLIHAPDFRKDDASEEDVKAPLRDIIQALRETYCRSVGVEYMHLQDPAERKWLRDRMEPVRNRPKLPDEEKKHILRKLCEAAFFEQFLQAKYLGQKRFSLEGADGIIPMLDVLVRHTAEKGCREIIFGMAHRGRLNVQTHIFGKPYEAVFHEFEECYNPEAVVGSGDVKYHKGFFSEIRISDQHSVRMLLADNPSHLESVDPVVEGIARARQDRLEDAPTRQVLPLLIHGDASFAGQGVVPETLNMSQLEGYRTGGTIHIIINNQIGFTTLPEDARSSRYSTDVAKMLMVPIFHVHGENPEALIHIVRLASDYRTEFGKDVVIDVVCYRRYGHNEGDEPYYTQPQMYDRIKNRPSPYELYRDKLIGENIVSKDEAENMGAGVREELEAAYRAAHEAPCAYPETGYFEEWEKFEENDAHEIVETGVFKDRLLSFARKIHAFPEGFSVHPKLKRIFQKHLESVEKENRIDWANAEMLAFASLLTEGVSVRLSGEDSRRGTFSQRHSTLVDTETGETHIPLNHLEEDQALFRVYDSPLSEYGVLGFDYGYSLANPNGLILWEAQFGDFSNGAQIIIDQYIAAAQAKWQRRSGLVLLLPHGYEGMGAEHSSARLERFLQLCANENIQVCNPTTPAQYFHLLRRQVLRSFRKPLIVMTPKSLLRHPKALSPLDALSEGHFQEVIQDKTEIKTPRRVVLCCGKVFYDLSDKREETKSEAVALVRVEQLYPFPEEQLNKTLSRYSDVGQWVWVQEESENMGAWSFMQPRLRDLLAQEVHYIGRKASASPATGLHTLHKQEQKAICEAAFDFEETEVSRRV